MKALISILLIVSLTGCASLFQKSDNLVDHKPSTEPGCEATTDFKQTLESILASDIEAEDEAAFSDTEEAFNKKTTITHEFVSKSAGCRVNSKLTIKEGSEKAAKYVLLVTLVYGNKQDGSKETVTITSPSPSILLEKARSIINTTGRND